MLPTHTARRRCRFSSMLALFVIGAGLWQTPARSEPVLSAFQETAVAAADTPPGNSPLILRPRFEAGRTRTVLYTVEQVILQNIQGQESRIEQTTRMGYDLETLSVDEAGVAKVKLTYTTILYRQDGPMGIIEYDSTKTAADSVPPALQGYAAMLGESFVMVIGAEGEILSVEGVDEMLQRVIDKQTSLSKEQRTQLLEQIKQSFGGEAVKQMGRDLFGLFPRTPIPIGGGWKKRVNMTRGFPLVLDNAYTLEAREGGTARFRVRTAVSPLPGAKPMAMGPLTVQYSLKGKQEGLVFVDEASGWPTRSRATSHLSGTITMSGLPGSSKPLTWPASMRTVTTFECR